MISTEDKFQFITQLFFLALSPSSLLVIEVGTYQTPPTWLHPPPQLSFQHTLQLLKTMTKETKWEYYKELGIVYSSNFYFFCQRRYEGIA
jgi:hypothetical protein